MKSDEVRIPFSTKSDTDVWSVRSEARARRLHDFICA
jgi:hypothetical protein